MSKRFALTIRLDRTSPRNRNRMTTTKRTPSASTSVTVWIAASTKLRAVVVRNDLQAVGNHVAAIDLRNPLLHAADNLFGVAAAGHQDDAAHGFGVAVLDHGAVTHFRAHRTCATSRM